MESHTDVILIVERDPQAAEVLRHAVGLLGARVVEAHSLEHLEDLVTRHHPTIIAAAIECIDAAVLPLLQSLAKTRSLPPLLLTGPTAPRVLASVKRTLEAASLKIAGACPRPLDPATTERVLAEHLSKAPTVLLEELDSAFNEHQLILEYQPKIAITGEDFKIQGVEALVRWQHPRRGLLTPLKFLGAIEELGLMSRLTDYVMAEAIGQLGQWTQRGLNLEMVVNLNPRLVRDLAFPERLALLLQEHAVPPSHLVLDVTESPSLADQQLMQSVFTRLRVLGIGLSLDNFGTGLSSLTELYKMPFSEIKVDHSIVADVTQEPDAMLIVKAIADLAHTLQMTACAAGIENRETLEFVRRAGFDSAQGRLFSSPVNAGAVEKLIRARPTTNMLSTGSWRSMRTDEFSEHAAKQRPVRAPAPEIGGAVRFSRSILPSK